LCEAHCLAASNKGTTLAAVFAAEFLPRKLNICMLQKDSKSVHAHGIWVFAALTTFASTQVMKYYSTGGDLAKDMGVELSVIEQTHEEHYQAAKKTETQPDAGPWPAYPSGKSWDEAGPFWGK